MSVSHSILIISCIIYLCVYDIFILMILSMKSYNVTVRNGYRYINPIAIFPGKSIEQCT